MHTPFEDMPKSSRVWIYQADRDLTEQEEEFVLKNLNNFLDRWQAHGAKLKCAGKLFYGRFLVLTVDADHHAASGCSIDSSVHFIQALGADLKVDWFSRTDIAFKINNDVMVTPMQSLKEHIHQGEIKKETLTFNNLVKDIGEFEESWLVPAEKTWVNRYFPN